MPDQEVSGDLEDDFPTSGILRSVIYTISCDGNDYLPEHIGDVYCLESARDIVQRLSSANTFSDCWRISASHLNAKAAHYLADLADGALKGCLFVPFRIPYGQVIGVYLIVTPWTDAYLESTQGMNAETLRQYYLDAGVPEALADVLHLAARAGARMLVFDADAPKLDGLPVYDDLWP
jgi:hypothetical protein